MSMTTSSLTLIGGGQNEDEIAENIFEWWISGKSYKEWYADTFLQLKLNFSDEKDIHTNRRDDNL